MSCLGLLRKVDVFINNRKVFVFNNGWKQVRAIQKSSTKVFIPQRHFVTLETRSLVNTLSKRQKNIFFTQSRWDSCLPPAGCKAHKHWVLEKLVSLAMVFIIPGAIWCPCPFLDYLTAITVVYHHYVGIEAVLIDYARPVVIGNFLSKMFFWGHKLCTAIIAAGLIFFIQNDIGIGNAIRRVWLVNKPCTPPPCKPTDLKCCEDEDTKICKTD